MIRVGTEERRIAAERGKFTAKRAEVPKYAMMRQTEESVGITEKGKTGVRERLNPKKNADKAWYLSLLDEGEQISYEEEHLDAVLKMLKSFYILRFRKKIASLEEEIASIRAQDRYSADDYRAILEKNALIAAENKKLNAYKCFFTEPYFARMDVVDSKEGYNSYYIGKKGDVHLEIVDWRAPLAVRYYQKSRVQFSINEYDYRTVLRRALSVKNGKLLEYRNEYLSVRDVLTPEEIAGRDEEILFDPYLRSIIKSRKDDVHVRDIIQTIQEQQFEIITRPERESFVLQGCAGSGKTMILLHRLSYLMYNNEALRPRDVLVITPSDSFNAFIDELAQVLELQRVKTITLKNYFFQTLLSEGIDLNAKMGSEKEPEEYLSYLYSSRFTEDTKKRVKKIYGDIYGLFAGEECREVAERVLKDCHRRQTLYTRVKNASVRVRRAVLGEMKDDKEGGFYFTKPFRMLMSAFVGVEDFLGYVLAGKLRTPDRLFREFLDFYRSAKYIAGGADKIFARAREDLAALSDLVEREILDLKRYRQRKGNTEVYTYAERIARREELIGETEKISGVVAQMAEGVDLFREFFAVMRLTGHCAELGKCKNAVDIARWLYRETVKRAKRRFDMKGIYPSDGYALSYVLATAGRQLTPRYGLVFVDEGQDISEGEYELLRTIHGDAAFNVFGDLKQNITPWRGVKNWACIAENVYTLNQNYRNTNEIVDFVAKIPDVEMKSIGLHGEEVKGVKMRGLGSWLKGGAGLKAVIAREEYLPLFAKRGFKMLASDGKISKTKINVMSVYESKGLEFSSVAVYDRDMTENEKYIAYTRALGRLALIED